ncbi:MAG TPA: aconitase X catalytic domain-containing protein [Ideonella sp.]|nr:aconitase X catalytic domain-containing protein [Ideonella sp.]
MRLNDDEQAMLDGRDGPAVQRAMDLLQRYGEALGAERLCDTRNVAGTVSATTPYMRDFASKKGGMDAVFSEFNLDSADTVAIPPAKVFTTHLQLGFDPNQPELMGIPEATLTFYRKGERYTGALGVQLTNTCTPYQVGNVPTRGEHCAWMESSAVVYCNSVLGARTNTEGRESTGSAMLTGKIPYWGYHVEHNRRATDLVRLEIDIATTFDWGLLGYYLGEIVQERVPLVIAKGGRFTDVPNLQRLKHFGASAASSGGVEMYHLVGVTPEALTLEHAWQGALDARKPVTTLHYGEAERQATWAKLNSTATDTQVDYVMLGCPHYNLEQIWEACRLLEGRKVHENSALWIFTPRAIKAVADQNGYTKIIEDAGGVLMSDSCSAMSRAMPKGTKVAALDSAKHAHYLPAITGVQAWFGTTADCIDAACTGRWNGRLA